MEDFIKHWGPALIAAAVFAILIAIVIGFGDQMKEVFNNLFNSFSNQANGVLQQPTSKMLTDLHLF